MAKYSSPTPDQIRTWCGILTDILGQTDIELDEHLDELLRKAEAEIALRVGRSYFRGTLDADDVEVLQESVAYGVAWRFLQSPAVQRSVGVQQPHIFEDGEGSVAEVIDDLRSRSLELAQLVAEAGSSTEGTSVRQVRHPFGDTTEALRTFTRETIW